MVFIISDYDKEWLAKKTLEQEYLTNEYLSNEQDLNFQYILKKFFNKDIEKAKLLNVGSGIFGLVSSIYSDYVGSPIGELQVNLDDATNDFIANNYIALAITATDGVYDIERVPTNLHFYDYDLKADVVLRKYSKVNEYDDTEYYLLQTVYRESSIENNIYLLENRYDYNSGTLAELTDVDETKDLLPFENTTYKPLRIIRVDKLNQYSISTISKIKPMVYSIDRKSVMFETQFLRNTETIKLFSGITKGKQFKDGEIDLADTGHTIFTTDSDAKVTFVDNVNSLLGDAVSFESNQIRRVSSITKIPTDFLGLDNSHGAIGEGSRSILHGSFFKKVQAIQNLYDTQLKEMYSIVAKKNGVENVYTRPDVYVKDSKVLLEELVIAKNEGLMPTINAMMKYLNIDQKQAEKYIKDMESDVLTTNDEENVGETQI